MQQNDSGKEGMRKKITATIMIFLVVISLTGCATTLYVKGRPVDDDGRPVDKILAMGDKRVLYEETIPIKSNTPYLSAEIVKTRLAFPIHSSTGIGAQIEASFMELTPLGILAPLIGYPHIHEQRIVGNIAIKLSPDENLRVEVEGGTIKGDSIYFDLITNENININAKNINAKHTIKIIFNNDNVLKMKLQQDGKAIKIIPDQIDFNINLKNGICSSEAEPAIVSQDGLIQIKTEEVTNVQRLNEIMQAEEKRIAEQAKSRELAINANHEYQREIQADFFGFSGDRVTECQYGPFFAEMRTAMALAPMLNEIKGSQSEQLPAAAIQKTESFINALSKACCECLVAKINKQPKIMQQRFFPVLRGEMQWDLYNTKMGEALGFQLMTLFNTCNQEAALTLTP